MPHVILRKKNAVHKDRVQLEAVVTALAGFVHTKTYNKKNMNDAAVREVVIRFIFDNNLIDDKPEDWVSPQWGNKHDKRDVTLIVPFNEDDSCSNPDALLNGICDHTKRYV